MLQNAFQKFRLKVILGVFKFKKGFDRSILRQINVISADGGRCTAVFTATQNNCNDQGHLANGFATTVMDTLTSFGLSTLLYTKGHVSITINMRYFQPVKMGDEITIKTEVFELNNNFAFLGANFKSNKTGEIVAKGSQIKFITGMVFK